MKMYPERNLYRNYVKRAIGDASFSETLPDNAKRITIEHMENAIYFAEAWDSFLDIGGGSGHYSMGLASVFKKGTVIELADFPEHALLPEKVPNLTLVKKKFEDYQNHEPVDFILLADIFEHMPDIKAFSEKISRLQNHGGVIYMMTPNPIICGPAPESDIYHVRHPFGHIKHYTRQEICNALEPHGYELMLTVYEEGYFRQKVKRIIRGLSRRDEKMKKQWMLAPFRFLFLAVTIPLLWIIGKITYCIEKRNERDELFGMTQCLIFKKIK